MENLQASVTPFKVLPKKVDTIVSLNPQGQKITESRRNEELRAQGITDESKLFGYFILRQESWGKMVDGKAPRVVKTAISWNNLKDLREYLRYIESLLPDRQFVLVTEEILESNLEEPGAEKYIRKLRFTPDMRLKGYGPVDIWSKLTYAEKQSLLEPYVKRVNSEPDAPVLMNNGQKILRFDFVHDVEHDDFDINDPEVNLRDIKIAHDNLADTYGYANRNKVNAEPILKDNSVMSKVDKIKLILENELLDDVASDEYKARKKKLTNLPDEELTALVKEIQGVE
jgi:hypothetical protein